jgi:hypothetical protein
MFNVSCSEEIACSPEVVFAFAGDYANDTQWRTGVLAMVYETSGAPAIGARTRETMRSMGRTVVTVGEVTEYSPTRAAFRSLSGPVSCDGSREFAGSPNGTKVTYSLTLRPAGLLRVLEPLLRVALSKQVQRDMRRLKQRLEGSA